MDPHHYTRIAMAGWVEYKASQSAERIALPVQPHTSTNIEIDLRRKGWSGFLQSIGVRSALKYAIHIESR